MLQQANHILSSGLRTSSCIRRMFVGSCLGCAMGIACLAPAADAQQPGPPKVVSPAADSLEGGRAAAPLHPMTKLDLAALNHDLEMVQSKQLLQLTTDLKKQLGHTSENTLSLDVVRKAEQIEHLARSLKERIRLNPDPTGTPDLPVQNAGR